METTLHVGKRRLYANFQRPETVDFRKEEKKEIEKEDFQIVLEPDAEDSFGIAMWLLFGFVCFDFFWIISYFLIYNDSITLNNYQY